MLKRENIEVKALISDKQRFGGRRTGWIKLYNCHGGNKQGLRGDR